jgi:hypothetical protein
MSRSAEQHDGVSEAIAIMTAWTSSDHVNTTFVADIALGYILKEPSPTPDLDTTITMVAGFINLAGGLLRYAEAATGATTAEILQSVAAHITNDG